MSLITSTTEVTLTHNKSLAVYMLYNLGCLWNTAFLYSQETFPRRFHLSDLAFWFFKTGFPCVTLEPVLELALVDQAALELTEIHLCLPPMCWH